MQANNRTVALCMMAEGGGDEETTGGGKKPEECSKYISTLCQKYNVIELMGANYDKAEKLTASHPANQSAEGGS